MERDSFVFYRSFYEAVGHLGDADRLACYDAIARYGLDGACDAEGVSAAIMAIVKPILDANNRRYENGKKGGRPKNRTDDELIESNRFRQTTEYKKWREDVLKNCGMVCAMCGKSDGQLNAHHIKNIFDFPELRLDVSNGIVLCNECHNKIHAKKNQQITNNKPTANQQITTGEPNVKCKMLNVNVNDKDIKNRSPRFKKPTVEEVKAYCIERQNDVDPQRFFDHYEANGWKVGGKSAMKDWKACVRTWEKNDIKVPPRPKSFQNQRVYDYNALENELLQKARAGT